MTLPAGITPIKVTGSVANNKGVPATSGTVTFRMPYPLSDGPDHVVLTPGSWSFPIIAGVLDTTASIKAARFVRFCDAFNIPLLTFVDVPGFVEWGQPGEGGVYGHPVPGVGYKLG